MGPRGPCNIPRDPLGKSNHAGVHSDIFINFGEDFATKGPVTP